jgi:hypothetical protein
VRGSATADGERGIVIESLPRHLLRLEGAAAFAAALALYLDAGNAWWWFLVLFLVPDLSMLGYLAGARVGAVLYDAGHFDALPIVLAVVGALSGSDVVTAIGLIWLAHIGLDRLLGYGLKYPGGFGDTHLQRV